MQTNEQQGIAPLVAIIIALLVVGGGAIAVKKSWDKKESKKQTAVETGMPVPGTDTEETEVMTEPTTLQVTLGELNKSGQSGQAVITEIGTSTLKIIVNLTGKPSTIAQPSHIHIGSCPNPGTVKYPLTSVDNGAAQTEIPNMTLAQLLSELPLAINVHKSETDAKTYVSCGNIEWEATTTSAVSDSTKAGTGDETKEQKTSSTTQKVTAPVSGAGEGSTKEIRVSYGTQGFSPKTITIKKGETVIFENKTGKNASVASDPHPTHTLYPEFDQYKTDQRGKTEFRFTFEKVGTWKYHDHLSSSITGTVIVTE